MEEEVSSFDLAAAFEQGVEKQKSNLMKQDLATLDVSTLTPLSPQVISRQATINIGETIFFGDFFFPVHVLSSSFWNL
jgi:hypothetical protein